MIQFRQLTLARGARRLIEDASLQIHPGWRVGLVGANGSGKSSLFALLRGELHAERGDCEVPRDWRIASVAQETPALPLPAIEFVLDGDAELRAIERDSPLPMRPTTATRSPNCTSSSTTSTATAPARARPACWPGLGFATPISSGPLRTSPAAGACG